MTTKPTAKAMPAEARPKLSALPDPPKRPDAMKQRRNLATSDQVLRSHYRNRPDVLVSGDGYLCYEARDARRSPRPDCIVSFNMPISPEVIEEEANGYVISEIGKPPEFVLEIASESTGGRDYTVKRDNYASLLVGEYWRFDRTGGLYHDAALAGDRLVNGVYAPIPVERGADGIIRGYSPALDLELHWYFRRLRFWNPARGEYLPDLIEALTALEYAERQRDDAIARYSAAEERIRQLEAELYGRQPDG